MTRSELISLLAGRFPNLTVPDAEACVKALLQSMAEALERGERIEIRGFGSFELHQRPPRRGRNPKTGEKVQVPAKHSPCFKPGKELRERVASAYEAQLLSQRWQESLPAGTSVEQEVA